MASQSGEGESNKRKRNKDLALGQGDFSDTFGPSLPPGYKLKYDNLESSKQQKKKVYGPECPSNLSEYTNDYEETTDDQDFIGPLPMNANENAEMEKKFRLKRKFFTKDEKASDKGIPKREQWMLELPEVKACSFGLGPRTFRQTEGPDLSDRSIWTDLPEDKRRKEAMGECEPKPVIHKGKELATTSVEEDTSSRPKSLLEMHRKKLKKDKKKEKKKKKDNKEKLERRPFDRKIDLEINRFNALQKKSIVDKAQLLNSRFSSGESKYL